jgi:Putative auto-transporter adhesin, head GIN domain
MLCNDTEKGRRHGRPFLFALLILVSISPTPVISRTLMVTNFNAIRLDAPVRVEVRTGAGVTARGEGDAALFDRLDMQVSGGLLTIKLRPEGGAAPHTRSGQLKLSLSTDAIRRASVNGGGALVIDKIKGAQVQLGLSGNGSLTVGELQADQLKIMMAGAGTVTLAGKAGMVDARLLGPGTVQAEALIGRDVAIANDGSGAIRISVLTTANVTATGTGNVEVLGKSACKVKQMGAGTISCGGKNY